MRLRYQVPDGCPSPDDFTRGIFGRTPKARPAAEGEAAREFVVRVSRQRSRFAGSFTLHDTSGAETVRGPLLGKTCAEVVDALAFSVAITIDPNVTAKPIVSPEPSAPDAAASTSPPAPPPASTPTPPAVAPAPPVEAAPASRPVTAPPPALPARPTTPLAPRRVVLEAGAHAVAHAGIESRLAFGEGVFLGLSSSAERLVAPSIRVWALVEGQPDAPAEPAGRAHFRWLLGRLDGCPLRLGSPSIALRACALFEAGELFASGVDVTDAQSARTVWLGLGGGARVAWGLASWLALELDADLVAPLSRHDFRFGPRGGPFTDTLPTPGVIPQASLGAALRIP